jgi:hypothetical protein
MTVTKDPHADKVICEPCLSVHHDYFEALLHDSPPDPEKDNLDPPGGYRPHSTMRARFAIPSPQHLAHLKQVASELKQVHGECKTKPKPRKRKQVSSSKGTKAQEKRQAKRQAVLEKIFCSRCKITVTEFFENGGKHCLCCCDDWCQCGDDVVCEHCQL